ncbi:hypothetical protein GCM10011487_26680 [Steroidobacter agaridevorans]|uniref:Uncharacterized protein n=1 Tax=Steroidobacter agaridevorans TaxID=2695856 RepID=A0A829YCV3_9GAMM|nr:hypothetical protein GCM10011487_26680 [Steroidobacter agaridevorans]
MRTTPQSVGSVRSIIGDRYINRRVGRQLRRSAWTTLKRAATNRSRLSAPSLDCDDIMNWTLAENNWAQFQGTVKARWLKLDAEQLRAIAGKRASLLSAIYEV